MRNYKLPKINISIQLILLFVFALLFGNHLNLTLKSILFAISLSLKEILLFVLPFVIFMCLFNSLVSNQRRSLSFVFIVFFVVCLSNFLSILAAFGAGTFCLNKISIVSHSTVFDALGSLEPFWTFPLPTLISNERALLAGLIAGMICSVFQWTLAVQFGKKGSEMVTRCLAKVFIPLLPLFALGFILKMQHEGILTHTLKTYAPIIVVLLIVNLVYLTFMFGIAANFSPKTWFRYIKNVLPVGILGFSTMSSLATMPVTLQAAEKNTHNPELSRAIIPATVNIHMVGDSFGVPILAMAILLAFGHALPTFAQYLVFTQLFMIAKFAIPGVPSGTILVMLPVLEAHLGFTSEMSAFMTAIYILFDSIFTAANVLGNSALVIMLSRIFQKIFGVKEEAVSRIVV